MIRIGILSPIPAVRAGLRALLESHPPDFVEQIMVTCETSSLDDISRCSAELDVLLVAWEDLPLPAMGKIAAETDGQLPILLLSERVGEARSLANAGLHAWGVLPLESSAEEITAAVYALRQGLIVGTKFSFGSVFSLTAMDQGENLDELVEELTERELQVLQLLGRGLANKQIAVTLGISDHTIKFHVSSIYAKLGVASRTEAVRAGVLRGLIVL